MKTFEIQKYTTEHYTKWNEFVAQAKNATFLFHRDFMEYHKDRFDDFSLLIFDDKGNIKAILPANRVGDVVYSHQGLTYGGLLLSSKSKLGEVLAVFQSVLQYLSHQKVKVLEIKQVPAIYCDFPSDEIEYACFLLEASLRRRDTLSVIDLQSSFKISSTRKQEIHKTKGLQVKEVFEFETFWNQILMPNLFEKHQAKPVHTLSEITLLHSKFPKNIRQFNVYFNNQIIAGTTLFVSRNVVHSQYISGSKNWNQLGGLDFLHHYLITDVFKEKHYFDFGISNENQGRNINQGLVFWKESFGARTVVQNFYSIQTRNFNLLDSILL